MAEDDGEGDGEGMALSDGEGGRDGEKALVVAPIVYLGVANNRHETNEDRGLRQHDDV